jgi:hypothetical protein
MEFSQSTLVVSLPGPDPEILRIERDRLHGLVALEAGSATDSFSVSAQGNGSFTGLAYTIPAHVSGKITAAIQTLALTSSDVDNLNTLIKGMVEAAKWQKVTDYQNKHASADLSFWGLISGGGSASYDETHSKMSGFGLSEDNIKTIINAMAAAAAKMSHVEIDFTVDNTQNDYAVSGSLLLYTIAGTIQTANGQTQYRLLANKGTAGASDSQAPASGNIIPLN